MKYSQKEIFNALVVISETCREHGDCEDCCFYDPNGEKCDINDSEIVPADWQVNVPRDWKAFRHGS